jgi:hypothetical protein
MFSFLLIDVQSDECDMNVAQTRMAAFVGVAGPGI